MKSSVRYICSGLSPTLSPPTAYPGNSIGSSSDAERIRIPSSIPLDDPEQRLVRAAMRVAAAASPGGRPGDGGGDDVERRVGRRTLVEAHDAVRPQVLLDLDGLFGREMQQRAVEVRLEDHLVVGELSCGGEAEDLEAPAVGQDRPRPLHQLVQPPEVPHHFRSRPDREVVRVGQDHRRAEVGELVRPDPFDGPSRPDRHEGRGLHRPVRRHPSAAAGPGGGVGLVEVELKCTHGIGTVFCRSARESVDVAASGQSSAAGGAGSRQGSVMAEQYVPGPPPVVGIPPLAGLCTFEEASREGLSIDAAVSWLKRLHFAFVRLHEILTARIPSEPQYELKTAYSHHAYLCAEHATAIRTRVSEMREPPLGLEVVPHPGLAYLFDEIESAPSSRELVWGAYGIVLLAVQDALAKYLERTNRLADAPSVRLVRFADLEVADMLRFGETALAALLSPAERKPCSPGRLPSDRPSRPQGACRGRKVR